MKNFGKPLGLFVFSFVLGYGLIMNTTEWTPINRDPAAIRQVYDFSGLSGSELTEAMKKRILTGSHVVREQQSLGVELGHFAMAKVSGEKVLACQEFNKVILRFEADGIATNGERPVMEIEGACEFSADMTKINAILIPLDKILTEKPSDGEIQYRDGRPVTLRFHHMTEDWPKRWFLTAIRLSNTADQNELLIEANEVNQILGRPMVVSF